MTRREKDGETIEVDCQNEDGPDPDRCWTYCTRHPFQGTCVVCKKPAKLTYARMEVLGEYHDGCFGYPACGCEKSHEGDCP